MVYNTTKCHRWMLLFVVFILLNIDVQAKTDEEILLSWTEDNEKHLLSQYPIITSQWFEQECMRLAEVLSFKKIKTCQLLKSPHINAYVLDNGHVYFSSSLMDNVRNNHQWASILAHENAHIVLKHYLKTIRKMKKPGVFFPKTAIRKTLKKHETDADQWAKRRLNSSGFDSDQIYFFLQRVKQIKGDKKNRTHIRLAKRIKKKNTEEIIDVGLMEKIAEINDE